MTSPRATAEGEPVALRRRVSFVPQLLVESVALLAVALLFAWSF